MAKLKQERLSEIFSAASMEMKCYNTDTVKVCTDTEVKYELIAETRELLLRANRGLL